MPPNDYRLAVLPEVEAAGVSATESPVRQIWLLEDGVVCVPCALFAAECASNDRGKLSMLGALVNTPHA